MKAFIVGGVALALTIALAGEARAGCNDDEAVAHARSIVARTCPCDAFPNHGLYVGCAALVSNLLSAVGTLPRSCRGEVVSCAARSTCGKRGAVTCCTTDKRGRTHCSIKRNAKSCKVPKGGSACVGQQSSCCDACSNGCQPTPTPTPVPTPTVAPTATAPPPTPTPPYGSPSKAFLSLVPNLFD